MANITINSLPTASTIDATNDILPIYTSSSAATQGINRNTFLSLSSAPVGLTDTQTLTNKTLTSPTINGATLSGTISGTYTIGGTPTFPSNIVTTTGTQTLTSKTLTSPTINSPTITNATISTDLITGYTTSNTGTVYGIPITTGVINTAGTINGASLVANSVTNASILTGNLYASKFYNPYKFSYSVSGVSVGTVLGIIKFTTLLFDTSSNYSSSTGLFTAPVTGFYSFSCAGYFGISNSGNNTGEIAVYKNGGIITIRQYPFVVPGVTSSLQFVSFTGLISLTAGDTISIYGSENYATSFTGNFDGYLVSAT